MSEIPDLEQRLEAMRDPFKEAPVEGGYNNDWPPDGDYQGLVRRFDFFEATNTSGHAFLKTEIEIALHPEYTGREVETVHDLEDPERIGWLKKHLAALGVNVESDDFDITQVRPGSELLASLLDVPVAFVIKTGTRINEKTGKPYRSVYVNERLGGPMPAPSSQAAADVPADTTDLTPEQQQADDKIPF
jgi:hypothetical protein